MSEKELNVKIISERENKLIGRKELTIEIEHIGKSTPSRYDVRKYIAELLKIPLDLVYVRKLRTEYGWGKTVGEIHIYNDIKRALKFEPDHIRIKNLPRDQRRKILEEMRRKGE